MVTVRVLLVDDDALVRAGLRMILAAVDDLQVVGEVDDLHSFSIVLDGHQGRSLFVSPGSDAEPPE